MEKEVTKIDKKENKLQKHMLNLHITILAQDLWQAYYQILSIIFLKKFLELNINTDMMLKNGKLTELNISIAYKHAQILKMI